MTDPPSPATPNRRRTPAFARYAALLAEALDGAEPPHDASPADADGAPDGVGPGAVAEPPAGAAEPARPDAPGLPLLQRPDPPWTAAVRSAASGLGPAAGGRPAPRPYAVAAPGDPAPAAGGARLDRRG